MKDIIVILNDTIKFYQDGICKTQKNLTLRECEECISKWDFDKSYNTYSAKTDKDILQHNFPYFVLPFYKYIAVNRSIPSFDEYVKYYLEYHKNIIKSITNDIFLINEKYINKKEFFARLIKAYPSLVREYHFSLMIYENSPNWIDNVFYSTTQDIEQKIDLLLTKTDGKKLALSFFIDTTNACDAHESEEFTIINATTLKHNSICKRKESKKLGGIYLYSPKNATIEFEVAKNIDEKLKSMM